MFAQVTARMSGVFLRQCRRRTNPIGRPTAHSHVINNGTCPRKKSQQDSIIYQQPPSLGSCFEMQQKAVKHLKVTHHTESGRFYEMYDASSIIVVDSGRACMHPRR